MATGRYGEAYTASDFFTEGYPSLQDCIRFIDPQNDRDIETRPRIAQGAHSYTVRIGHSSVAQFRKPAHRLDPETLPLAQEKYDTLGPRRVTEMVLDNLFCSAGCIPSSAETPVDYRTRGKYAAALDQLLDMLPERFHGIIELLKKNLATLYAWDWPQAVNNLGLCPAVLKVDVETGELKSCSSWSHISVGPFGLMAASVEHFLGGIDEHGNWVHVHDHEQLRTEFLYTLTAGKYWGSDVRLGFAKTLGSLFNSKNGFGNLLLNETYDMDACSHRIAFLDAVVLEPLANADVEIKRQQELARQNIIQ